MDAAAADLIGTNGIGLDDPDSSLELLSGGLAADAALLWLESLD